MGAEFLMSFFYKSGRISRTRFWLRLIFIGSLCTAFGMLAGELIGQTASAVFAAIFIWSSIALSVQRLHDIGQSGWHVLAVSVPVFGVIYLFFLLAKKGADGLNRYGVDPLSRDGYLTVDISR